MLMYSAASIFVLFVAFFAVTSVLKIQNEERIVSIVENATMQVTNKSYDRASEILSAAKPRDEGPINRLRIVSIVLERRTGWAAKNIAHLQR